MCELCPYALVCKVHGDVMVCAWSPALTLRGFCVMSSKLVDSKLSFMATYRRRPSSSGNRECRSPATRGSVSRRPFWISSVEKDMKDNQYMKMCKEKVMKYESSLNKYAKIWHFHATIRCCIKNTRYIYAVFNRTNRQICYQQLLWAVSLWRKGKWITLSEGVWSQGNLCVLTLY